MTSDRERIAEERKELRNTYKGLFDELAALLFRHDPIGINFETNTDEYEPEVGTILPRLKDCESSADVTVVVHEEFCRWFEAETAGPPERYEALSTELWAMWSVSPLRRGR